MTSKLSAYWSIGLGVGVVLVSGLLYLLKTTALNPSQGIDIHVFESYGAFVGGIVAPIFALAGVLLLLTTLAEQKDAFIKQQVESRFFQLVSLARDNSDELRIQGHSGRNVFLSLLRELTESYRVVQKVGGDFGISSERFANIAYLGFFYGAIGVRSSLVLRQRLEGKCSSEFIDALIEEYIAHSKSYKSRFYYRPFRGHQSRLGHYYRHLFQTVTFINRQPTSVLTYTEKYTYIKTLRAQLSTHEQLMFFWNSVSEIGLRWERDASILDPNDQLITKYNFIKNIPDGFSLYANPRDYYPLVFYEGLENAPDGRAETERHYS